MKTLRILSVSALCLAFSAITFAQSKTETFKVNGNCGMCKSAIEKAAKTAGANTATWDKDTKDLTVTYMGTSTNTAKIQQKIADVGYDNVGFTAKDDSYDKLHACCKYDRTAMATMKTSGGMNCDMKGGKCDMKDGKCDMSKCKEKDCCKDEAACKSGGCCGAELAAGGKKMDCCKGDEKCDMGAKGGDDCCKKK
jgi:hypothetical protein